MTSSQLLHASAIELNGVGILVTGLSGSGKSGLVAELLTRGAKLIADDQVILNYERGQLMARAPGPLKGKLELYGMGVFDLPQYFVPETAIQMELQCMDAEQIERLPSDQVAHYQDIEIPAYVVAPEHSFTPAKVELLSEAFANIGQNTVDFTKKVAVA